MAKTTRIFDIEKAVHGNKVKTDFIAAPFTQIVNEQGQPRRIPDLENNLKANFGIERVYINSTKKVTNEFGVNGENVSESSSKDDRIRIIGDFVFQSSTSGQRLILNTDVYIEITFYGTGLNILTVPPMDGTRVLEYFVDGGAAQTKDLSGSNVLEIRNYEANHTFNVVSGLSLGLHTVRMGIQSGSTPIYVHGFDFLNESSQIAVNAGQPFIGSFASKLDSQNLLDFKPSSIVGAKGARVVTYLDEEGNLTQTIQEVDSTAQYLASTDHTNEDIIRRINYREFGRNRADDFSTLSSSASDRAYTLDDGTTTLVGNDVRATDFTGNGVVGLNSPTNGSSWTLTFVGTGLDFTFENDGTARTFEMFVDDVSVGQVNPVSIDGFSKQKVCSGLPYGTHTVKFLAIGAALAMVPTSDFIIYGPKKPTLPENVIELADYNVVADLVTNTTQSQDAIATGVVRKTCAREIVYTGTHNIGLSVTQHTSGFLVDSNTSSSTIKYTFFGTGFDLRWTGETNNSNNISVNLNGVTLNSTNYPTAVSNVYDGGNGASFNLGTGVLNQDSSVGNLAGCGWTISELPLGLYTVELTLNNSDFMRISSFDIITPIHVNSTDFKTGSLSLLDLRANSKIENESKSIDLTKAKAFLIYDQVDNVIHNSYNISAILEEGNFIHVYFKQPFKDNKIVMTACTGGFDNATGDVGNSSPTVIEPNHVKFWITQANNGTNSLDYISIVFFGELENEESIDLEEL